MSVSWGGPDRRTERRHKNPDGFMTEWRPTLLYLTAATVLSAVIVIADIHNTADVKRELRDIVAVSCQEAVSGDWEREAESDAAFAELFNRIEWKLDKVLEND